MTISEGGGNKVSIICDRCGRFGKSDIANCPERLQGSCPYKFERESLMPFFGLLMLGIGFMELVILLVAAIGFTITNLTVGLLFSGLCGIPFLLIGMALTGLGVVLAFGQRERIWQDGPGWFMQQILLHGWIIDESFTGPTEKLHLTIPEFTNLNHPASIIAIQLHPPKESTGSLIYWNRYAVELLLTSLVSLVSQKRLMVETAIVKRSFLGGTVSRKPKQDYFFVINEKNRKTPVTGALEQRIIDLIKDWLQNPAAKTWPYAIPTHRLAIGLVAKMRWNPGRWLYDLVHQDLLNRGLMASTDDRSSDIHDYLHADGHILEQTLNSISTTNPAFIKTLRGDLFRGFSFMEWTYLDIP